MFRHLYKIFDNPLYDSILWECLAAKKFGESSEIRQALTSQNSDILMAMQNQIHLPNFFSPTSFILVVCQRLILPNIPTIQCAPCMNKNASFCSFEYDCAYT